MFVPVNPFQPSIMFACKATAGLERLASDKRSSLLQKFVAYGRRKFYNIGDGRKNFCEKEQKTRTDFIKKKVFSCNLTQYFGAMTFSIMTLSITTLSITTLSIMTLNKMTFSIMTFSKMTLNIMTFSIIINKARYSA